jgi:enoyl-CoA hydratase
MSSAPLARARPVTKVQFVRNKRTATVRFVAEKGPPIMSSPVLGELTRITEALAQDACIRFVVFRSSGPVFNAGADVDEVANMSEDQGFPFSKHGQHVFDAIENLPQITFAAMNGHALGGGCELALACSFRIMVGGTRIGQPEVKFGVIPAWGGTKRLFLLAPFNYALRMLYSGEPISAEEAHRIGLVDEVVPAEADLDAALERWFSKFAGCAPQAVIRIKRAVLNDDESHQFGLCLSSADAREGMRAFVEKRKPAWAVEAECDQK